MGVRFDADGEDYTRSSASFAFGTCTFTCWVNIDVDRNAFQTAWDVDDASANVWLLQTDSDGVTWTLFDGTSGQSSLFTATVGTWYFIAVSKQTSASGTVAYWAAADAVALSSATSTHAQSATVGNLRIGESMSGAEWLNGRIAGLKIWQGVALTQAEIEAERFQYLPHRTANLYGFYPFLEGGAVAGAQQDFSGNGNSLTGGANSATADGPPIPWRRGPTKLILGPDITPPQFARPDSDISAGTWTATPLFEKVDESIASDADFISSVSAPSNTICELGLSNVTDPVSSVNHTLRVRRKKSASSTNQIDMRYRVLQGTTEIASWTDDTNISSAAFSTVERTLSGAQADAITDYTNLRVEIRANQNTQTPSAPTFVAAGTGSATATSGTSLTPGLPSGFQANDIHILIAHHSANGDWNTPSGWTLIPSLSGNNTAAQRVNVWWRRAVGGDTAPTVTLATNTVTTVRGARIYGYRGCISTGDPWDSGAGAGPSRSNNAASATIATTSITTVAVNCLVAFLQAYEDDPSTRSLPSGYTASGTVFTSTAGNDMAISAHHKALSGTGTENPSTTVSGGTFANSVNVGILIALKPEPFPNVAAQVSWVEFEVPGVDVATDEYPAEFRRRFDRSALVRM